jgi:hypothetical protein
MRHFTAKSFGVVCALFGATVTHAAAPAVFHSRDYQSLVHAGPDEVIAIGGYGFSASDRVVYGAQSGPHPGAVPTHDSADSGLAPVISVGDPPYSLTARLPRAFQAGHPYRIWVVNAANEWSAPITVNDPRPLWVSPSEVNASADPARLGRKLRVIGRNLRPNAGQSARIRLQGPATYILTPDNPEDPASSVPDYVLEAALPTHLTPGNYTISVSRDARTWVEVSSQTWEVKADPPQLATFSIDDSRFGSCRANDEQADNSCLERAIAAATAAGGGTVVIPTGTWDLSATRGLVLPVNVELRGDPDHSSRIVRHDILHSHPRALLTVAGHNIISDLSFSDAEPTPSEAASRPIITLGEGPPSATPVSDVIMVNNDFVRVGRAIEDSVRPLIRLWITHNRFGAFDRDLQLVGDRYSTEAPNLIEDSIVRWNTFIPGSFLDVPGYQGVLASELSSSHRLDFSNNVADGTAVEALQNPGDPKGWRAAFFWNLNGNQELTLIAQNHISCSGDKAGDGEAIAFDSNGDTYAFDGAQTVSGATATTLTLRSELAAELIGHSVDRARFYRGHWIQVVEGPGAGQVRKIQSYNQDTASGTVTFTVTTPWDLPPRAGARIVVGREYWQVYTVGNEIDQRKPLCQKANLNYPSGGQITYWTPTADSVIDGNKQYDTSGILLKVNYNAAAPGCRECGNGVEFQAGLEVRNNLIQGEYDWDSDCSRSGISASMGIVPTPNTRPPLLGIGLAIDHNRIIHADGLRGGGINFAVAWHMGPPPGKWQMLQSMVIQHNSFEDLDGPAPRPACRTGQDQRTAIRLEGSDNLRNTVLYANDCRSVTHPLFDGGKNTVRLCDGGPAESCVCGP